MFSIMGEREDFYQWDLNQKLIIGDASVSEVHFCNKTSDCSLVVPVYEENGLRIANVPNIILQSRWDVIAYAYVDDHTKAEAHFKIRPRTKPSDYVYTETEVYSFEALEQQCNETEAIAIVASETAERAEAIARGRARGYVFDTADDMLLWYEEHKGELCTGDNLYIRETDTPDYWFDGAELLPLEADKVEMTDYLKAPTNTVGLDKLLGCRMGATENQWFAVDAGNGVALVNSVLLISGANKGNIDEKESKKKPICPAFLDYAVKVGITTNTETLTDEEKAAACEWIGAATKEYVDNAIAALKAELQGGDA